MIEFNHKPEEVTEQYKNIIKTVKAIIRLYEKIKKFKEIKNGKQNHNY